MSSSRPLERWQRTLNGSLSSSSCFAFLCLPKAVSAERVLAELTLLNSCMKPCDFSDGAAGAVASPCTAWLDHSGLRVEPSLKRDEAEAL